MDLFVNTYQYVQNLESSWMYVDMWKIRLRTLFRSTVRACEKTRIYLIIQLRREHFYSQARFW